MSAEPIKPSEICAKSCAVVLKRLDEKLLCQYLQKYDANTTKMVPDVINKSKSNNIYSNDDSTTHKNTKRKLDKSNMNNKLKQIKRKRKPLVSNDDESPTGTLFKRPEPVSFNSRDFASNSASDLGKNSKDCQTSGSSTNWKVTSELKNEIKLENILNSNFETGNWKNTNNEVEVIKENTKHKGFNNIKEQQVKRADVENAEDEYEFREDDEDDRSTVIFERSPQIKRRIEYANEKFKNGDAANSRKDIPVSLNSATVRPPEAEAVGQSKPNVCRREIYVKRVCSLVKRLHELYRIISQLQRELPKNVELAVHFSKVIKAQKENFFEEILKSQNTVIECYEKLLVSCGNSAEEVVSEISQRAFLNVGDVVNIISRCFFLNRTCESYQNQDKPNCFPQPKISDALRRKINEYLRQWVRRKEIGNYHLAQQQQQQRASFPSEGLNYQLGFMQVPAAQTMIPGQVFVRKSAPVSTVNGCVPQYHQVHRQNKSQIWTPQRIMDPQLGHQSHYRPPNLVLVHPDPLTCNINSPNTTTQYICPQNIRPVVPTSFPVNPTVSHSQRNRPNVESSVPGNSRHPVTVQNVYIPTYMQQKSTSDQSSRTNVEYMSTFNPIRQQNHPQRSFACPSSISNVVVNTGTQALTSVGNEQYLMGNSPSISNQKPQELLVSGEEMFGRHETMSRTQFENVPEVLDPTVPQKLTMINCRLQAEPTLRRENEATELPKKLKPVQSIKEETNCNGSEENSKSRVYVCAQNGCKMPGIRVCKDCQSIIYCSKTCQLKHWVIKHSTECYELRKLRGV